MLDSFKSFIADTIGGQANEQGGADQTDNEGAENVGVGEGEVGATGEDNAELHDGDDTDSVTDPVGPSPELAEIKQQLASLQEQNDLLRSVLKQQNVAQEEKPAEKPIVNPFESESFDHLAETMGWDDTEQKAMKLFLKSVAEHNKETTIKEATTTVSDIVNSQLTLQQKREAVKQAFYESNPELKGKEDYVSYVAKSVASELQGKGKEPSVEFILEETAKRVYNTLGLTKGVKQKQTPSEPGKGKEKPAFASTNSGSRKPEAKKTDTQKMIEAMINL